MPEKVFISHSSKDKVIADAVRQHLESAGVVCWIAPRDIEPGADWTEGIMRGIASSRIFVLVFSGHANDSDHVRREVGKAFALHLPVIPFRTEAIEPRDSLGYFLESVHWLDATKPPVEQHLPALTERVKALLNGQPRASPHPATPAEPLQPASVAVPKKRPWLLANGLIGVAAIIAVAAWFFVANNHKVNESSPLPTATAISPKSIAILPFENLSAQKEDTYFADGVQDDILNDLAKIAQLTVISRASVMQYRASEKRDLRQIANALGVANVLEGTVQRSANRVRVNTELIAARNDKTIWADSFDRDLTDIFTIQSEVAQTIATKLAATLSPEEKQNIEKKPTENLRAYDLYLRAKELILRADIGFVRGEAQKLYLEAVDLLDHATQLDPNFALAYCRSAHAHDQLYLAYALPEQRALAEAAIRHALVLEPVPPEAHLAYAFHLYRIDRNYDEAREQLALARRGLPNDAEAILLEAFIDRRQGLWQKAIQEFKDAITRDLRNSYGVEQFAVTLYLTRQFPAAALMFDRLIELSPDQPILKAVKEVYTTYFETGDDTSVRAAIAAFPASMADDRGALSLRLIFCFVDRDWAQAKELIQKMNGGDDEGDFAYAGPNVPVACYSIVIARLQGEQLSGNPSFIEAREQLNQKVQKAPDNGLLLSQLAVVDALLNNQEAAIVEAKRAVQLLPISKDAVDGPYLEMNLAVVYAWTNQLDLAFETLNDSAKVPAGITYGQLKRDPYWEPLRQDPRYEELLAELAPRQ